MDYNISCGLGDFVDNSINLLKLCVGAEQVEDLMRWSTLPGTVCAAPCHPDVARQEAELNGGSLYWVQGVDPVPS